MVAIFTGIGAGLERGSGSILGNQGLLGTAAQGRGGEGVFVNAANGNLLLNRQDEFLVGLGPDIAIGRTYNSQATLPDDNNDQWRQSTDRRVYGFNAATNTVRRVSADGSDITYTFNGSAYVATDGAGAHDKIVKSGNQWIWTDGATQNVEKYDDLNNGRIVWQGDTDGNSITYTYIADKLDKATTADGAWVQYSWAGNNITRIVTGYTDLGTNSAKTLTRTWYDYNSNNQLTRVRTDLTPDDNSAPSDAQSYWISYAYGANGRVSSVVQKDGSSMAISYDSSGRVLTLTQAATNTTTRFTTLSYGAGFTTITDPTNQVTRLDFDGAGNLTKVTAPAARPGAAQQTVSYSYNANGDVTSVTDALGAVSSFSFDERGNILTATDRLGGSSGQVVTRTYGSKNELLTETRTASDAGAAAASVTSRFVYDSENHLRYVVSGEGDVTEYRYTAAGLLEQTIRYPEQNVAIGSGSLTEAAMNSWRDAIPDRRSAQVSVNSYDLRGNLSASRDYGAADTVGAGSNAEGFRLNSYTYDQAGRLLARRAEGQSSETFIYDGLGRITASADVNGGTTSFVFNDTANTTTVTLASGYVTVSTYNLAGDLVSQVDGGSYVAGGTATNQYDKLGRLRIATNAVGLNQYYAYDNAGRLVAEVNHSGDTLGYRYDAENRLIATVRYATRLTSTQLAILQNPDSAFDPGTTQPPSHANDVWNWSVYDAEGRTLARIDGDGSFQRLSYDKSGQLLSTGRATAKLSAAQVTSFKTVAPTIADLPALDANASVTRQFYDRSGRAIGTLDAEGFLTRTQYNKAGQIVAETAYFNAADASVRAAGTFNALVASVGTNARDRVVRYVYDGQALLRYSIDGLNQITGYGYDSAGLQVSTTRYAAPIAATADYGYRNIKALAAPLAADSANRTSWAVRDAAGRIGYAINADGGVTGYTYDNQGQAIRTVEYATKYPVTTLPSLASMDAWSGTNTGSVADRVTRNWYTARGEVRYTVDAEGYVSRNDFNAAGQITSQYAWDHKISISNGATISHVDLASNASGSYVGKTFIYDAQGNIRSEYNADNVVTLYDYAANGQLAARYDAYGTADQSLTTYTYDMAGRLVTEARASGTPEQSITTFGYNGLGDRISITDARGAITSFAYDKLGQLKTRTDSVGGVTAYEYNGFGEAWKVTDARGFASYSWYDGLGRVTHIRNAADTLSQTSYTVFGDVASVTQWFNPVTGAATMATPPSVAANPGEDAVTSFVYDKLGRVASSTDALGFIESYGYDAFGNRTSVTAKSATESIAAGLTTTYGFDRLGQLVTETLPVPTYDSAGNQVSATIVSRYEYDARGNRTKKVEADNTSSRRTTIYVYDKNNRLTETRNDTVSVISDDLVTIFDFTPIEYVKYDARGNAIELTDAGGARTLIYYDDLDRKSVQIEQTSAIENRYSSFTYDANGNVTLARIYDGSVSLPGTVTATPPAPPAGAYRESSFTYDALNRQITSQVSGVVTGNYDAGFATANLVTTSQYDANGNVVKLVDPNGGTTLFWYDALSRKTAQVDAEGALTTWAYDPDGNVIAEMRFANRVNTQSASPVNLSVLVATPPSSAVPALIASAGYNGEDRYTTYTYDKAGNRLTEVRYSLLDVLPGGSATPNAGYTAVGVTYRYNGLGQVVRKTEATGDQTDYAYDGAGRLVTETRAAFIDFNGQSVRPSTDYRYDGLGNLARAVQAGATGAAARATTYAYSAGGRLASVTDASGFTRSYAYDAVGRVKREQYTRATAAGGVVTEAIATRYDLAGRTIYTGTATWNGSGFSVVDYSRTLYNGFGDVSKQGSNGLFQTENTYDNAGRLTATTGGDGIWKLFGYDRNGNQTVAITSAGTNLAGVSFTTALSMVGSATVNATYTDYDKRNLAVRVIEEGRQLSTSATEQLTTTRGYNAFGEVVSETNALGATINYSYNNMGKRVKVENPTVTITLENGTTQNVRPTEIYYYDASGRLTGSRDANGALTRQTLLAGTGYAGSEALTIASIAADGGVITNGYDIHGDVRRVTDQVNRVTTQNFDAMGRVTEITHAGGLVEGFAYDGLGQRIQAWNNQFQTPVYGQPVNVWVSYGGHWEQQWPIIGYTSPEPIYGQPVPVWIGDGGHWEQQWPIIGYTAQSPIYGQPTAEWVSYGGHWGQESPIIGYTPQTPIYGEAQPVWVAYGGHWEQQTPIIGYTPGTTVYGDPELVWVPDEIYQDSWYFIPESYNNGHWEWQTPVLSYGSPEPIYGEPTNVWVADTYSGHWDWQTPIIGYTPSTPIYGQPYDVWIPDSYSGHWNWQTPIIGYTPSTPIYGEPVNVWVADNYSGHWDWQTPIIGYTPQTPIYGPPETVWIDYGGHMELQTPVIGYAAEKALTEYDALGRVTSQRAFGGDVTTTSYAWDGGIATSGVGSFGGWAKTITVANGRASVERTDSFGRTTAKTDLGGHVWSFTYDAAGRLTSTGTGAMATSYSYFNTGELSGTITGTLNPAVNTNWSRTVASYGYDRLGQRLTEQTFEEQGIYTPGYWVNGYDPDAGYSIIPESGYWMDATYNIASASLQNSVASYDALGRMRSFTEHGSSYTPAASIAWEYDANGNIRRNTASYRTLDQQGNAAATSTSTDYWFRYDNMNRLVTDRGILRGGQVVRGEGVYGTGAGQDILYNAAGERIAVLTTAYTPGSYDYYSGSYEAASYAEARESYVYDAAGRLIEVQESRGGAAYEGYDYTTGQFTAPTTLPAAAAGGTVRSRFVYDTLGRQTGQTDYQANGTTVVFSRSATFNTKSQLVADDSTTRKSDGTSYRAVSSYDYGSGANYALGSALTISTINYKNNNDAAAPDTLTTNSYAWWDGAVQNGITHKPNTAQSASYYTGFGYNDLGQLTRANIADGRQRTVTFRLNADGQILRRDEADNVASTGDPHEVWYRFNGRQLGSTGNNGTNDLRNAASIAEREQVGPTTPGAFRGGQTQSITYADFADSSDAINSYSQGSSAGGYTVRSGDTLAGIAQAIWGDASLWYKLAQANGLSGSGGGASPAAGTVLMLPAGVVRSTYNASTLTPYNPAEAIGDLTPSTPTPQAPKKNKCGVFGAILLAVVAIAVTIATKGAGAKIAAALLGVGKTSTAAVIVGGALAGAAGSVVSQGVGLATGIQDKFSFKGVALAALGGGIGGALGPGGAFGEFGAFSKFGNVVGGALRGAVNSAATQGIAVATGLQSKFDFVGVAAAGIGGGVGGAVGGAIGNKLGDFGGRLITSTASGLANAATRSAIEGSSFGDNIIAALPDIIGQAVGGFLGDRLTAKASGRSGGEGASPAENALLTEAQNSANRVPAAEANRLWIAARANGNNNPVENKSTSDVTVNNDDADIVVVASRHIRDDLRAFTDVQFRNLHQRAIDGKWDPDVENAAVHYEAHTLDVRNMVGGGTSLALDFTPVVGTAKALTQLGTGKDVITGEPSSVVGNSIAVGASLIPGARLFARGAGRAAAEAIAPKGTKLIFDKAAKSWTTPEGLIYEQGSAQGNRIKHVLEHTVPNPNKPTHTLFNVSRDQVLGLVDEAWAARGAALPKDPGAFVVPMGRAVGQGGETSIKIVVRPGTSKVITAYPVR